jgi:hypothetical protein
MARVIKQYRFYNTSDSRNQPVADKYDQYVNGTVFTYPILQLGIQALPGTKFYLNTSLDPIIIGSTGIYELDLDNQMEITSLTFDKASMAEIDRFDGANGYLIVDTLYDDGREDY